MAGIQGCQVVGGLCIGVAEEFLDQVDKITAGVALGKTVPGVFGDADDKGIRVVSAVDWARTDKSLALFAKPGNHPLILEHGSDGDGMFEVLEATGWLDHASNSLCLSATFLPFFQLVIGTVLTMRRLLRFMTKIRLLLVMKNGKFSKRFTFTLRALDFMANMSGSILFFQKFIQDGFEGIENNEFEHVGNPFFH